jgi:hypothetical protein
MASTQRPSRCPRTDGRRGRGDARNVGRRARRHGGGDAFADRHRARFGFDAPYRIAGKSGTAQRARRRGNQEYNETHHAEHLRHQALFVAFAPAEAPTYRGDAGGRTRRFSGSKAAAPVARAILDAWLLKSHPTEPTPDRLRLLARAHRAARWLKFPRVDLALLLLLAAGPAGRAAQRQRRATRARWSQAAAPAARPSPPCGCSRVFRRPCAPGRHGVTLHRGLLLAGADVRRRPRRAAGWLKVGRSTSPSEFAETHLPMMVAAWLHDRDPCRHAGAISRCARC